ncbi:MAG: hypothetical protein WD738_23145 [Pirellulales bacterium]
MSAIALVIGLVLSGQVNSANDRFPVAGGQGDRSNQANTDSTSTVRPLVGTPPSGSRPANNAAAPVNQPADPYLGQATEGGADSQRSLPLGGSPPRATGSALPPLGGLPAQPNTTPGNAPAQPPTGLKPTAMMRAMLTAPRDSQLSGVPMPLIEVLAGAGSRLEQSQRVESYWDLYSSVADYYLGLREQEELRRLRSLSSGNGTPWQQFEAELAVRMDTSLKGARASQLRLAGWLGPRAANLPLPADLPHCAPYHSYYQEIFSARPSPEAEALAELLSLRYAELKDAAAAVTRAEDWLNTVARNDTSPDGAGTLRALEFLALRRRAFVQIARDYNRRIARYAELASPGEIGAQRLIGMLIKVEGSSTATRPELPGATGRQSRNDASAPPRTFADGQGWEPAADRADAIRRDESVQPISSESGQLPHRERSLLVSPR